MDNAIHILQWGMLGGRGGIENFIMDLYSHMDRSLVQFDFLVDHNAEKMAYEDDIQRMGGRIFRVQYAESESFVKSRTSLARLYHEHPEIRGVHVHANFPYAAPLKSAMKSGIPLRILHSHNSGLQSYPSDILGKAKWALRSKIVAHDIDVCPTHYFACSELAAEFMFPSKPFTWVRNGIDTHRFAYDAETRIRVRHELGLAAGTVAVGFCGRLRKQKNPLFLLDVFHEYLALNANAVLLIVGDGELHDDMEKRIGEYGIENRVRFLGGERSDTNDLYQAMDAFVLPSIFEGFGIVYAEAQCAGLPCLASADVVPESAHITDLLEFVPLRDGATAWAGILDQRVRQSPDRYGWALQVRERGFDMTDVAKHVQDFYLEHAL